MRGRDSCISRVYTHCPLHAHAASSKRNYILVLWLIPICEMWLSTDKVREMKIASRQVWQDRPEDTFGYEPSHSSQSENTPFPAMLGQILIVNDSRRAMWSLGFFLVCRLACSLAWAIFRPVLENTVTAIEVFLHIRNSRIRGLNRTAKGQLRQPFALWQACCEDFAMVL